MRVRDLLGQKQSTMITVGSNAPVQDAIRLMIDHSVGGLPVVGLDGAIIGFVSERDMVQAVHEHHAEVHALPVERVMRPIPACDADQPLEEAMRLMTSQRQRHLLVNDTGTFIGVISVGDIVKYRLEQLEMETGVLRDYVAAQRARR